MLPSWVWRSVPDLDGMFSLTTPQSSLPAEKDEVTRYIRIEAYPEVDLTSLLSARAIRRGRGPEGLGSLCLRYMIMTAPSNLDTVS